MKLNMDWILGSIMYSIIAIFVLCCICHTPKSEEPVNRVHFYVARDKNGSLFLYLGKPERRRYTFVNSYGTCSDFIANEYHFKDVGLNKNDYDNLKWEDEPVEVFLNMEN